jgi:hypothetical protein
MAQRRVAQWDAHVGGEVGDDIAPAGVALESLPYFLGGGNDQHIGPSRGEKALLRRYREERRRGGRRTVIRKRRGEEFELLGALGAVSKRKEA